MSEEFVLYLRPMDPQTVPITTGARTRCIGDGHRGCPVMIPAGRLRCQFCQRTIALNMRERMRHGTRR